MTFSNGMWDYEQRTAYHCWNGAEYRVEPGSAETTIYLYRDGDEVYGLEFPTWDAALAWIEDWEGNEYAIQG